MNSLTSLIEPFADVKLWSLLVVCISLIGPCEEVTVSIGFDLFRLRKLNKRNVRDIVINMISKSKHVIGK